MQLWRCIALTKEYINIKIFGFKLNFSSYILANNYILIRVIHITKYLKGLQLHFNKTLDHSSRMTRFVEKRRIQRIYKKIVPIFHIFSYSLSASIIKNVAPRTALKPWNAYKPYKRDVKNFTRKRSKGKEKQKQPFAQKNATTKWRKLVVFYLPGSQNARQH